MNITKPISPFRERLRLQPRANEDLAQSFFRVLSDELALEADSRDRFIDPDPVSWIEKHFRIPETPDNHFPLGEYQKLCLRAALMTDANGDFPYSVIVWSDIKKSAKSCVAAAVALWRAFNTPWGSIKIVANDLKQADSRVSFYIRRCIELNPYMKEVCHVKPSGYLIELPNKARIESIPVDPKGEAGGNDDMVCFSELWAANSMAAQRLWTETTLSPTKMGRSFRWIETYAGYSGESPLLETLYLMGTKHGHRFPWAENFEPPLEVYENQASRMFCLWNQTPRLSFQTQAYYAQEEAVLAPNEFRRVHRNTWVSSESIFVPLEWWDACYDSAPPTIEHDEPCILAVDAAVSGDTFALIMLSGSKTGDEFYVRYSNAWKPPKGGKINFALPEAEILRLIAQYNIAQMCYDPYQLEDMAGRLRRDLIVHLKPFKQGDERTKADKFLYDQIRNRKIHHEGDQDLREHVGNANSTAEDKERLRIIKRSDLLKIDLCVSLSMAVWSAHKLNI